jgi:hypothetical protein
MEWSGTFQNQVAAFFWTAAFCYLVFWHAALILMLQGLWFGIPWKYRGVLLKDRRAQIWKQWFIAAGVLIAIDRLFSLFGWVIWTPT